MQKANYSRSNPSPRYRELVTLYRQLHEKGDDIGGTKPEETFAGTSLVAQSGRILELIRHTGAQTLLDYGCGKALLYRKQITIGDKTYPSIEHVWSVKKVALYDPAHAPYTTLPQGKFDGVICTDVLEHCPEDDIPWILSELFSYANRFVFANIAAYPAERKLPNGENAHCTIRPLSWWQEQIVRAATPFPDVQCQFIVIEIALDAKGQPEYDKNGAAKMNEHFINRLTPKAAA